MKKSNKKGFTIVELIVVIATLAILAAILIPTFAGIIKKANDSAYQQERTNQMIQDAVEKIEKGKDNYMSWEDVEEAIAEALKKSTLTADRIIEIVGVGKDTGLTNEQLTKILDAIANKKFSDTQVKVILEGVQSGNASLTKEQIDQIIAKLPQVGITQEAIAAAVSEVITDDKLAEKINKAIEDALENIPTLDEAAIAAIVEQIIAAIVSGEGAFQLSYFTLTNAYNSKVIALNLINSPNDDVSKYKWEVSNNILSFSTTYDSDYNKYEIIRLNNVGKALITATLKSDTTKKAYLVVDIKADLDMDTSKNISMTGGAFTKNSTNKITAKIPVKLYIEGCEDVEKTTTVSADNSYFNNYRTEWSVTSGEENATLTPLTKATAQLAFIKSGSATINYTVYDENENCREFDETFTCSLTGVAEVTVDETTTKYYSFDEAWKAVKETGGTLTLLSNIKVGSPSAYAVGAPASKYTLSENKEVILNLGEYTLSWSDEAVTGGAGNPSALFMFNVVKDATLTINATTGGIDTKGTNVETSYAVVLGSWSVNETYWEMWKGNVVINNGNFYGGNSVVHVYAGTATINGGHFELNTNAAAANSSPNYLVNVQDGSWSNNGITTVVSITGGEFVGFNPSGNPEGANTTYVASGYTATETSTGVWTVTANE